MSSTKKTSTEYVREWRAKNPERNHELRLRAKAAQKRYYQKNRDLLDALKNVPCADCGGKFPPECMDFDHVRGKKSFGIATQINRKTAVLLKEVAKCDVVCANCHRIRTRARRAH